MPSYRLVRYRTTDKEVFGVLMDDNDNYLCTTLEDAWNDNLPGNSCIPIGTYKCKSHNGTKYKDVWEVCDVPGRSAILIHNGNTRNDTQGCILVGSAEGEVGGLPAVINSRITLNKLRSILPKRFVLTIFNGDVDSI